MIELIFVIVILGILAAIAVPKLTSVKDDAEATKVLSNLDTFVNKELVTSYAANEKFPNMPKAGDANAVTELKALTNVKEVKVKTATATGVTEYTFKAGSTDACFTIKTSDLTGVIEIAPKLDKATTSKGCQVAVIAAAKNGFLKATIDDTGKVTAVDPKTEVSSVGGDSSRYDTSGVFGGTTTNP